MTLPPVQAHVPNNLAPEAARVRRKARPSSQGRTCDVYFIGKFMEILRHSSHRRLFASNQLTEI